MQNHILIIFELLTDYDQENSRLYLIPSDLIVNGEIYSHRRNENVIFRDIAITELAQQCAGRYINDGNETDELVLLHGLLSETLEEFKINDSYVENCNIQAVYKCGFVE